jgi:hypothetical protein
MMVRICGCRCNQNECKKVVKDVAGVDEKYLLMIAMKIFCLQKELHRKLSLKVLAAKPALCIRPTNDVTPPPRLSEPLEEALTTANALRDCSRLDISRFVGACSQGRSLTYRELFSLPAPRW